MRAARGADLLALDLRDRRFGYPLELLIAAARAGWRVVEIDIDYHPRAAGTRSKVTGSIGGRNRNGCPTMKPCKASANTSGARSDCSSNSSN